MKVYDDSDLPRDGEPLRMMVVFRTCPMVVLQEDGRMLVGRVMAETEYVAWAVLDDGRTVAKNMGCLTWYSVCDALIMRGDIAHGLDEDSELEEVDYVGDGKAT